MVDPTSGPSFRSDAGDLTGKSVGRFLIRSQIGSGGMGEVYLAEDTKLKRQIALKRLSPRLRVDQRYRRRLFREAEKASVLNCQYIAGIYDVVEHNGEVFLVMEYIEGSSLRHRLNRQLAMAEFTPIALQCAEALAAAHAKGVIHCDIKPENIMLTSTGQVKVLDFGLAKRMPLADENAITASYESRPGGPAGTSGYIAPEVLLEEELDGRADIFSLGVVFYEALSGRHPFRAAGFTATADRVLHEAPPPLSTLNPAVLPEAERIVTKMLAKDPTDRFTTAAELLENLRQLQLMMSTAQVARAEPIERRIWLLTIAALLMVFLLATAYLARVHFLPHSSGRTEKVIVAVLPFENLSRNPDQDYFSDGLTEEMIMQLGRLQPQRLGVIARTSVMQYKGIHKPIEQIGRELGVGYILEGSVRHDADRVRITAELVNVSDKTNVWTESYDDNLRNILAIQSKVAGRIAKSLAIELLPSQEALLARTPAINPKTQEAYLKGRYYWNQRTAESLNRALQYFEVVIAEEPNWPLGYVGAADCYNLLSYYGHLPLKYALTKAKEDALKALALDESLAEAHVSLSYAVMYRDWDLASAERELKRAIALNPNYSTGHLWYAGLLARTGRLQEALEEIKRAQQLDPLSPFINSQVGFILYYLRQYDLALSQLQAALELDPNFWITHLDLGFVYERQGKFNQALAEFHKARSLSGGNMETVAALGHAYASGGNRSKALQQIAEVKRKAPQGYVSYYMAVVYAGLNDKEHAFLWLEKAYQDHEDMLDLKVDPWFDNLRSDSRYTNLLRRIKFPL